MEASIELVRSGIEPEPPAHMSEHVLERLTLKPTELARQIHLKASPT